MQNKNLALLIAGTVIGAAVVWFFTSDEGKAWMEKIGNELEDFFEEEDLETDITHGQ